MVSTYMVVEIPPDIEQEASLMCALCRKPLALPEATTGLLFADGSQSFAHAAHMQGRTEWFVGWALFLARERDKAWADIDSIPYIADAIDDDVESGADVPTFY